MKNSCLVVCCFICFLGFSQKKYEKESRISKDDFPEVALQIFNKHVQKAKRVRFYKETDSSKTSYEAKFKLKNKKYSVEFNEDGVLEDIEVNIDPNELLDTIKTQIVTFCKNKYQKYTIKKVQKQFFCDEAANANLVFKAALEDKDVSFINYEVVVWRSYKKEAGLVELTFSKKGKLLSERPFAQASYDHILY